MGILIQIRYLFGVCVLIIFCLFTTRYVDAVGSCGGTFQCHPIQTQCNPLGCVPGIDDPCSCTDVCIGGTNTFSCSGGDQTFCSSGGSYACSEVCAALVSWSCSWQADACQVAGDCGSNRTCCGGTPNYCSNNCYDCAGNYICATPTSAVPTPTSAPSCNGAGQYGPCAPDGYQFPSTGGYYLCSGGCYVWVDSGSSTPTPTSVGPTAAATPTPGGCTACGSGVCCGGTSCDPGPPASCVGGPPPPPACTNNGGACTNSTTTFCEEFPPYSCYDVTSNNCCTGYCSGGTCQNTPSCSGCQSWNALALACQDDNSLCSSGQTCQSGTCVNNTYSISGSIFVDIDSDGTKDAGESNYTSSGASIRVSPGSSTSISSGNYSFTGLVNGTYSVIFTPPSGYSSTSTNPRSVAVAGSNRTNINFGIIQATPSCVGGLNANPVTVNPGSTSTLSVTSCSNVPTPPPTPFTWTPDVDPGNVRPDPTIGGQTDSPPGAPTSSTTTWTAPSCPASTMVYIPQVTVGTGGNTVSYTTNISVPGTVSVTTHVREVSSAGSCTSSSGSAYNSGGTGANVNITGGGGAINQNQTTSGATGQTTFTCLPQSNYTVTLQVPSGYDVLGTDVSPAVESPLGSNGVSFATGSSNQVATFCIAPLDPWFQTSVGDVRILNLNNPVPTGLYGSTDANYPGIFYSSDSNANLGRGAASVKNWVINNEYSYNADTENRNGGMSYDFYKSKTKQDGVTVTQISSGTFDQTQITGSGVYEAPGDLTINLYTHVNGRRVVILVNGNVTINASTISIPQNQGIFIVAAKGNITIGKTVGTATLNSTASNIDGYYTAQGSIILDGDTCADGTTSDLRLNIGGTLVANSLKPFSITGTGTLQNKRSLCTNNLLYPSLYINARPDFITQLTDFYKTSYTKWQEVNP